MKVIVKWEQNFHSLRFQYNRQKNTTLSNGWIKLDVKNSKNYIWMTEEPEHDIPVHDSSHGSPPPLDFHPTSCGGALNDIYRS